jgi:hypothetical protein
MSCPAKSIKTRIVYISLERGQNFGQFVLFCVYEEPKKDLSSWFT